MAYDEGMAQLLRDELADLSGVTEKKMFGGLCFLLNGNMVCGVHKGGSMFRVGKAADAAARAVPGTGPMVFTGKPMAGFVDAPDEVLADDDRRAVLIGLARAHAQSLPPK